MKDYYQIEFVNIPRNDELVKIVEETLNKCYEQEHLFNINLNISLILTDNENIKTINKKYRNIDKPTDVLSFPMFEKTELDTIIKSNKNGYEDILGDIIISIPKVEEQAIEYEHSFKREFTYMIVHGFYHLMGYDHENEVDKTIMRRKEEDILKQIV